MAITVDKNGIPTNRPKVDLSGTDGNVMALLGRCRRAGRDLGGWTSEQTALFAQKAFATDTYEGALETAKQYFEVT